MECFLRLNEKEELEGVFHSDLGKEIVFGDLDEFSKLCPIQHPYLKFIRRSKANTVSPVDWPTLLSGIRVTIDGSDPDKIALFDYQIEGVRRLIEELDGRALLAPDMGMGKTLMALVASKHYGGNQLIIVPSTLTNMWVERYKDVFGEDADIKLFNTRKSTISSRIVVVSYGLFRDCVDYFMTINWTFVIVDESHNIKRDSGWGRAVCRCVASVPSVVLLTGTPQEASAVDLFNQIHCLFPKVFFNKEAFEQRYTNGYFNSFNKWIVTSTRCKDELYAMMGTMMIRMKDDIQANLPPKWRHIQPFQCVGKNLESLRFLQKELSNAIAEVKRLESIKAKKKAINSHQQDIMTISNSIRAKAGWIKASICGPWLRQLVESKGPKEKFALFVDHLETCAALEHTLTKLGYEYKIINGSVKIGERPEIIKNISDPEHPLRFIICSYRTCSAGISFCPAVANMVFIELAYLPTTMMQAEKRINRPGATKDSHYIWLEMNESTDKKGLRVLQTRYHDNAHVIDGDRDRSIEFQMLDTFEETIDDSDEERKPQKRVKTANVTANVTSQTQ
jgi:SNF2 family DNA or RNA helicase